VAAPAGALAAIRGAGPAVWWLLLTWFFLLFELQWQLDAFGISVLLKIQVILYAGLIGILGLVPLVPAWRARWTWYVPLALLIGTGFLAAPFAPNLGLARDELQTFTLLWCLLVGTVTLIDTARRAELLLHLYWLSFAYFGLIGASPGSIAWHVTLANQDSFGSYMVIGLGFCGFLATAATGRLRQLLFVAAGLCVVGVVSSFARGAVLAMVAVFGLMWARSRRKGVALLAGIALVGVMLTASSLLHPGQFWTEITSVFDEGTAEGTGEDRWILWTTAMRVFAESPVIGVGPGNWGVVASEMVQPNELGGRYWNPQRLYEKSLHNMYLEILAEHGILGILALVALLADFWRRNLALRSAEAQRLWEAAGGTFRLRGVALGLEAALVANLLVFAIYSHTGKHWPFTLMGLNLLLYTLVFGEKSGGAPAQRVRKARGIRRSARLGTHQRVPQPEDPRLESAHDPARIGARKRIARPR
jgi:O-antigen ligase